MNVQVRIRTGEGVGETGVEREEPPKQGKQNGVLHKEKPRGGWKKTEAF
jgi:hypothetical protein